MNAPIRRSTFEDARSFHTPLLVIQKKPIPPRLWLMLLTLLLLAFTAAAWIRYGSLEIVVSGRGRIVPLGDSRVVQSAEAGTVRDILAVEGQTIKAGQSLVELDSTERASELKRLNETYKAQNFDIQRIEQLLAATVAEEQVKRIHNANTHTGDNETQLRIRNRYESYVAKREALIAQQAQQSTLRMAHKSMLEHFKKVLPLHVERREDLRMLVTQGNAQKVQLIDAETRVLESEHSIRNGYAQIEQSLAASEEIARRIDDLSADFKAQLYDDLATAQLKLMETSQQIVQARRRTELMSIKAPSDGVLNRISINTIGASVHAGQLIATIIPNEEKLEAQISLSSRDIGFVSEGQDVTIKVDSYPYSRNGYIRGKVQSISREAVLGAELTSAELIESGARQVDPSDPFRRSYIVRVRLNGSEVSSSGFNLRLKPGMTVVADLITGQRHVYEYLFSSLVERVHEFARER